MSSAFDAELGLYQGRIKPTGIPAFDGEWVICLGHDLPGQVRSVAADSPFGDFVNIARSVDFTGDTYLTHRIHVRPPAAMPAGVEWQFVVAIGATLYFFPVETGERARNRIDLSCQIAHLGVENLSYALALVGTAGLYEVELPGVYVDAVVFDTATDAPRVHQRDPEPADVGTPPSSRIFFAVSDSTLSGVATVALRVDGTLVMTATAAATTFLAPGWSAVVTPVPGAFTSTYEVTPAGPFASGAIVNLDVDGTITGDPTLTTTSWSFTVADVLAPAIVSATALDHELVEVVFNEPVVQVDAAAANDALNPANYTLSLNSGAPAVVPDVESVEAGASPDRVRLVLDKPMSGRADPPVIYLLTAANLEDEAGNPIAPPGDTATFAGYVCAAPEGRDISLYSAMPTLNRQEDTSGDLKKFLAVFQDPIDLLFCLIDRFTRILDPDTAPGSWVDLMLLDLGNPFRFEMTLIEKRKLVKLLVDFAKKKGTGPGLVDAIRFFTGIEVKVHVPYWAPFGLDDPELILEETFILGGNTQADLYTFEVRVPVIPTDEQRVRMIEVVEVMKAAHEHYKIIVPDPPVGPFDHWELEFSLLEIESILH